MINIELKHGSFNSVMVATCLKCKKVIATVNTSSNKKINLDCDECKRAEEAKIPCVNCGKTRCWCCDQLKFGGYCETCI